MISIVIWDWNGTVLDDLDVSLDAVNYILEKKNLPPITKDTYYEYLDSPIIKFYEKALGTKDVPFEEISFYFNDYYKKHLYEIELTSGIKNIIATLHEMGIPQMIISASHISYIEEALVRYELEEYFDAVIGAQDYAAGSKIDRAEAYMESHGISREGRLVIGDTRHDLDMADRIGADCILLTSGHEGRIKLENSGAKVLDSLTLDDILTM